MWCFPVTHNDCTLSAARGRQIRVLRRCLIWSKLRDAFCYALAVCGSLPALRIAIDEFRECIARELPGKCAEMAADHRWSPNTFTSGANRWFFPDGLQLRLIRSWFNWKWRDMPRTAMCWLAQGAGELLEVVGGARWRWHTSQVELPGQLRARGEARKETLLSLRKGRG